MTGTELLDLLNKGYRRSHLTGSVEKGIVAALDLEGRLFAVINNKVINRVVPSAILNRSNRNEFLNPGGDTLWPAPEGTCHGYEYATGKWRVPPAITGAVWEVVSHSASGALIRAEIDLVNNNAIGIPCEFERHIEIDSRGDVFIQKVTELIRYIGRRTLARKEFTLAPWSLCQFDSGRNCRVIIPEPAPEEIWDMYSSSLSRRGLSDGRYVADTETDFRYQLGLGENIKWIEYVKSNEFRVKRHAGQIAPGQSFIDISDSPPDQFPSSKGVSLSVYCDPSGFMEMEACGGCPDIIYPGVEMSVNIITEYQVTG